MLCIVLAAGEGKRMRPLTARRPKVMLPVGNLPILEHLVISAKEAGINRFIFVVGYEENTIRDYFGNGEKCDVSIKYVTQRRQKGTADALLSAAGCTNGKFIVINGDMIIRPEDLKDILSSSPPVMAVYESERPEEFGTVTISGDHITGLWEKCQDPQSNLVNAGAYLFDTDIFNRLKKVNLSERGELELTDALMDYISKGSLSAINLSSWQDIGRPWNILDANEKYLDSVAKSRVDGIIEEGVTIQGEVSIGTGSTVKSGTYIEGPCIIGDHCKIGPHAYIRGSTSIGDNCHIGHATEVKNSVIMDHTNVPHFNYVGDSVIGSGCNLGAGTKIANLRHDKAEIRSGGVATGRRKFGAIVGDGVKFGINCSVNVGTVVGSGSHIGPHSFVEGMIENRTIIR